MARWSVWSSVAVVQYMAVSQLGELIENEWHPSLEDGLMIYSKEMQSATASL